MLDSTITMYTLMTRNRWVEDVLRWHGLEPDDIDPRMSVRALCWAEGLDPESFIQDLFTVGAWDPADLDSLVPPSPVVNHDIDDEYSAWDVPIADDDDDDPIRVNR